MQIGSSPEDQIRTAAVRRALRRKRSVVLALVFLLCCLLLCSTIVFEFGFDVIVKCHGVPDWAPVLPKWYVRRALSRDRALRWSTEEKRDALNSLDRAYGDLQCLEPFVTRIIKSEPLDDLYGVALHSYANGHLRPDPSEKSCIFEILNNTNMPIVSRLVAANALAGGFQLDEEEWRRITSVVSFDVREGAIGLKGQRPGQEHHRHVFRKQRPLGGIPVHE